MQDNLQRVPGFVFPRDMRHREDMAIGGDDDSAGRSPDIDPDAGRAHFREAFLELGGKRLRGLREMVHENRGGGCRGFFGDCGLAQKREGEAENGDDLFRAHKKTFFDGSNGEPFSGDTGTRPFGSDRKASTKRRDRKRRGPSQAVWGMKQRLRFFHLRESRLTRHFS